MTLPVTIVQGRLIDRVQQRTQMRLVALEQLGAPFPLLELIVLGLQPVDLFHHADIRAHARRAHAAP